MVFTPPSASHRSITWSYKAYTCYTDISPRLELPAFRTLKWYSKSHSSRADESGEDTTLQSLISNLPPSLFHIEIHHARSRGTWSALLKHIFNQTPAIRHLYISQCGDPLLTDILSIIFLRIPSGGRARSLSPVTPIGGFFRTLLSCGRWRCFFPIVLPILLKISVNGVLGRNLTRTGARWTDEMYHTCRTLCERRLSCQLISSEM